MKTQEISFLNAIVYLMKGYSLVKYSKWALYKLETMAKTKNKRISKT